MSIVAFVTDAFATDMPDRIAYRISGSTRIRVGVALS